MVISNDDEDTQPLRNKRVSGITNRHSVSTSDLHTHILYIQEVNNIEITMPWNRKWIVAGEKKNSGRSGIREPNGQQYKQGPGFLKVNATRV